jgi:hypothetical protein
MIGVILPLVTMSWYEIPFYGTVYDIPYLGEGVASFIGSYSNSPQSDTARAAVYAILYPNGGLSE